ncbi:hypothetical protein POM88_014962 [Heracleum sosnowskyi]|uniref:Inositol-pentakisphosphate 2-kinase n=1 Tax=Heracleum sosnowskyi TaxID=360622 RepID=A0AAD8IIZ4_9APIA|nr:hypothetical protein POM88_014962 [Heracleum sosnowskyi]
MIAARIVQTENLISNVVAEKAAEAFEVIMLSLRLLSYRFSWDQVQFLCHMRRRYIQLYASFLQKMSNVDNKEMRDIEKDLDPKVILLWRYTCVFVAKEFLEAVERNVLSQRPSWRVNDAKANTRCESALLLSDLSVFPHSALKDEFCISVEIKPKCGFLPTSRYIAYENYVKRCITRFKMHQELKLHQGNVSFIPCYFILKDKLLLVGHGD